MPGDTDIRRARPRTSVRRHALSLQGLLSQGKRCGGNADSDPYRRFSYIPRRPPNLNDGQRPPSAMNLSPKAGGVAREVQSTCLAVDPPLLRTRRSHLETPGEESRSTRKESSWSPWQRRQGERVDGSLVVDISVWTVRSWLENHSGRWLGTSQRVEPVVSHLRIMLGDSSPGSMSCNLAGSANPQATCVHGARMS